MPAETSLLRVAIVSGVNPGKWTSAWRERRPDTPVEVTIVRQSDQRSVLTQRLADVVFARLPIDREGLSVIRLYTETPVVMAAKDHPISLFDSVTLQDLDGETVRPEAPEDAVDLVVAGAGVLVLPQPVARHSSRRDLAVRPVTDAPATEVALAWLADETTPDIEQFVGIVRGRTAATSRGGSPAVGQSASGRRRRR